METNAMTVTQMPELFEALNNDQLVKWMNKKDCIVHTKLQILNGSYKERLVKIFLHIGLEQNGRRFYRQYELTARMTKNLWKWFYNAYPVKLDDGQYSTERLTGYQKFLRHKGLSTDTKIQDMEFACLNASPDYYENPFRVSIMKLDHADDYVKLSLCNEAKMIPLVNIDPATGQRTVRFKVPRRQDNNDVLTLSKSSYRRLSVDIK